MATRLPVRSAVAYGQCELVADGQHFYRVVRDGMLKAKVSLDLATADFKAMLVPEAGLGRAHSIVEVFRRLASRGVEIRLLHAGTPSSAALRELKSALPANLTIRRCPRLHSKAVIVDCKRMYLGSANLTGAGLGAKAEGRRNFELGVWTESPALIDAVLRAPARAVLGKGYVPLAETLQGGSNFFGGPTPEQPEKQRAKDATTGARREGHEPPRPGG